MSIFDKECPLCSTGHPLSAERCGCGFSFDPSSLEQAAQKLVLAAQDEELMENYLAARVSQANETFKVIQTRLQADPENNLLQRELESARLEMESAQAILAEQEAKTDKARKAADAARGAIREANEAHERRTARRLQKQEQDKQAAIAARRLARETARLKTEEAARLAAEEAERQRQAEAEANRLAAEAAARQRQAEAESARKLAERQRKAEAVAQAKSRAIAAQRKQMEEARKLAAKAAGDIAAARDRKPRVNGTSYRQVADEATGSKPAVQATISHNATHQFRAVQSEKASAVMALAMRVIEAGDDPEPTTVKKKAAAAHAPKIQTPMARSESSICPHCTATLASNVSRCACGYTVDDSDMEISGLALTEADLAALGTFSQVSITKLG